MIYCCDCTQAMHDFTARCLERNAGARPTPAQLLAHPFLERVRDVSYLARALLGGALQQPMPSSKSFALSSDGTQTSPVSAPHAFPEALCSHTAKAASAVSVTAQVTSALSDN